MPKPAHVVPSYAKCIADLEAMGQKTFPVEENGTLWCNATWDSVLCWPAIPANTSISMGCPPFKGLDIEREATRHCHWSGRWSGKEGEDFEAFPNGYTNFQTCFIVDPVVAERAQEIARGARILEFVGLWLSFVTLITAIGILAFFRRLRVFRNHIHLQLMLGILLTVIIRLTLYIDQIFTEQLGLVQTSDEVYTINNTKIVCEAFFFLLEYGKTVAFAWMFIEGFNLYNTVVVSVFQEAPKLWKYLLVGWGLPLVHVSIWLAVVITTKKDIERCLGHYYMHYEFWLLDAVRLAELVVNFGFLLNIVGVLWYKVKDTHSASESQQVKKSVKAALMLVPLLGIPNVLQLIPFSPTRDNITWFGIFTYIATSFYCFQGFLVALLFCFTNREVINVLKSTWSRYRLQHSSADVLRRGSRSGAQNGAYSRGSRVTELMKSETNGLARSSPKPRRATAPPDSDPRLPQDAPLLAPPPSYDTVLAETPMERSNLQYSSSNDTKSVSNGVTRDKDRLSGSPKICRCRSGSRSGRLTPCHCHAMEHCPLVNGNALNGSTITFMDSGRDSECRITP